VEGRTRVGLGRREDLGADCANCFGLCCVALAFAKSADFPFDKPAGVPCANLDAHDACRVHRGLRERGFKGCAVFDCFGAGQKVSRRTFQGRSWREDAETRMAMFSVFPVVRRLHELLWYLDEAITLVGPSRDAAPWLKAFEHVRLLSDRSAGELAGLDVDAEYDAARDLLAEASEIARAAVWRAKGRRGGRSPGPGSDLAGARLAGADFRGITIRGSIAIAADLSGALLGRCDVLGVDMRDADLSGADLDGAIYLTQMQVNSARGDASTVLPAGFERPSSWSWHPAAGCLSAAGRSSAAPGQADREDQADTMGSVSVAGCHHVVDRAVALAAAARGEVAEAAQPGLRTVAGAGGAFPGSGEGHRGQHRVQCCREIVGLVRGQRGQCARQCLLARLEYPCGRAPAASGEDDGDRPSVLCSGALDEARGGEAVDEADGARVSQAEHGAQLRYRSAVEELVHRGEGGRGGRPERRDRFDGGVHLVGDDEAQGAQDVGGVLAA
jgi:hypothetical protein